MNFIIGKNNVGKSNIINFLANQYSHFVSQAQGQRHSGASVKANFNDIDHHISASKVDSRIAFPICKDNLSEYINNISEQVPSHRWHQNLAGLIRKILTSSMISDEDDIVWFTYKSESNQKEFKLEVEYSDLRSLLADHEWRLIFTAFSEQNGGYSPTLPDIIQ